MPVKRPVRLSKKKRGQTVIEFALVSVAFIFMLVLTINAILAFSVQQYMSYTAFMAARAYQAAGNEPGEAASRARLALNRYLPDFASQGANLSNLNYQLRFPLFNKPLALVRSIAIPTPVQGVIGQDRPGGIAGGVGSGAIRIVFDVPLAQFPLSKQVSAQFGQITIDAESYLGREVSRAECREYFDSFLLSFMLGGGVNPNNATASRTDGKYMEDNGC